MAAPCITDTCSISTSIDPNTRRLQIDVSLAPTGGLECVDGAGLGLSIYGDPAAAGTLVDTCYQQLGTTTAGEAYAIPKRAKVHSFSSSASVGIPQNANEGNFSANAIDTGAAIANPYACASLAIITGRFRVRYSVGLPSDASVPPTAECLADGDGEYWVPFNGDVQCRMFIDGGTSSIESLYPDCSGIMKRTYVSANELKDSWIGFARQVIVPASASLSLYADARHVGTSGQSNINTAFAADNRGFMCDGEITFMPFAGEAI